MWFNSVGALTLSVKDHMMNPSKSSYVTIDSVNNIDKISNFNCSLPSQLADTFLFENDMFRCSDIGKLTVVGLFTSSGEFDYAVRRFNQDNEKFLKLAKRK